MKQFAYADFQMGIFIVVWAETEQRAATLAFTKVREMGWPVEGILREIPATQTEAVLMLEP